MIAMLMDCKGELIRGTRGSRVLLDESADIELIVKKHLPPRLALVVWEHYCNHESFLSQKLLHCACSSRTYYIRLHDAHVFIQGMRGGGSWMTLGVVLRGSVLLCRLVLLGFWVVGQAQAAPLLTCPTVQPSPAPRRHEHSGHVIAPRARTRAFSFLSIHKKKE